MTLRPDIFTNVHKGIRRALFDTCVALGRAGDDAAELREQLRGVLHFIRHHGENEDLLLVPLLATRAAAIHARIQAAHGEIERELRALEAQLDEAPVGVLFNAACVFTARYLAHMAEEECELEPEIRAAVPVAELEAVGRGSLSRTSPVDMRAMLAWMLPAMPPAEAEEMLARVPPAVSEELRALLAAR